MIGLAAQSPTRRIKPRHQALGSSLLISRRAVDLACQEKPRHLLQLQTGRQRPRVEKVVFNGIGGLQDFGRLKPLYAMNIGLLNIERKRRRNPVRIDRMIIKSFWLQKHLMAGLLCKSYHFIFN